MAGTPAGGSAATGGPAVHPTLLVGLGTLGARTAALLHSLLAEENLAVARLHPCVLIQDATAGSEKWDWASWVEVPGTGGGGGPGGPPATRSAWQDALASLADVVRQEFDRRLRITQAEIAEIATVLGRAVDARERSVVLVGDLADPLGSALLLPTAVIARSCLDALRLDAGALLCLLDAGVAPGTPGPEKRAREGGIVAALREIEAAQSRPPDQKTVLRLGSEEFVASTPLFDKVYFRHDLSDAGLSADRDETPLVFSLFVASMLHGKTDMRHRHRDLFGTLFGREPWSAPPPGTPRPSRRFAGLGFAALHFAAPEIVGHCCDRLTVDALRAWLVPPAAKSRDDLCRDLLQRDTAISLLPVAPADQDSMRKGSWTPDLVDRATDADAALRLSGSAVDMHLVSYGPVDEREVDRRWAELAPRLEQAREQGTRLAMDALATAGLGSSGESAYRGMMERVLPGDLAQAAQAEARDRVPVDQRYRPTTPDGRWESVVAEAQLAADETTVPSHERAVEANAAELARDLVETIRSEIQTQATRQPRGVERSLEAVDQLERRLKEALLQDEEALTAKLPSADDALRELRLAVEGAPNPPGLLATWLLGSALVAAAATLGLGAATDLTRRWGGAWVGVVSGVLAAGFLGLWICSRWSRWVRKIRAAVDRVRGVLAGRVAVMLRRKARETVVNIVQQIKPQIAEWRRRLTELGEMLQVIADDAELRCRRRATPGSGVLIPLVRADEYDDYYREVRDRESFKDLESTVRGFLDSKALASWTIVPGTTTAEEERQRDEALRCRVIEASRQEFSVPFRSIEAQDIREPLVRYEARRPVTVLANLLAQFSRPALRWDADAMVGGHEEPDQRTVLFARDADAHPLRSSPELPPPRSDVSTGMRHHLALARSVHGLPLACIFGMVELYDRVGSAQDVDPATVAPSEAVRDALRQGDFDPLDARRFSDRPRSP